MEAGSESRRKILCVSVMKSWGGGEEFILKLHDSIKSFEFIVVTPEGKAAQKFSSGGIRTIINNYQSKVYRKSGWSLPDYLQIFFGIMLSTLKFISIFKKERPAIVLANGLFAALYVLPAVILTGKKQITIQHLIFETNSIEKNILKLVMRFTDKIVCVSNAVKENIYSMVKQPYPDKMVIIPNGIRAADSSVPVYKQGDIIHIGMTGSITRIKGIHFAIEALEGILKDGKAVLHIYGEAGGDEDSLKYESELKNMISHQMIEDKVLFEGHIESKEKLYSSIDILISFSVIPESFSFSVLEAMAYKKIVIAADSGGPKELIKDGENGFLVEMKNTSALKTKILYCLGNLGTDEFYQIRHRAFETVRKDYSIEKFVNGYTNLFDNLNNKAN